MKTTWTSFVYWNARCIEDVFASNSKNLHYRKLTHNQCLLNYTKHHLSSSRISQASLFSWPSSNTSSTPCSYVHQNILTKPAPPPKMHPTNNKQMTLKLNVENGHNLHTNKWKKNRNVNTFNLPSTTHYTVVFCFQHVFNSWQHGLIIIKVSSHKSSSHM